MDFFVEDYEMEEPQTSERQDRLSELPLSLIFHILSFLPMEDVVSTTILSRRWKNLWITVPCLNFFDCIEDEADVEGIRNFINRALILWRGTRILKFKIDFDSHFAMSLAKDIDFWVLFAKENKVEELNIHLAYLPELLAWDNSVIGSKKDIYQAPKCLNSCSSMKKLSLVGCNLRIREPPAWNQLKSLRIDGFCFSERLINRILLGTPLLEAFDLRLMESHENLNIRSRSLKKLKIEKYLYYDYEEKPSTITVVRIGCPNLEMLEVSGILYSKYVLTNVSSLADITLRFDCPHYYDDGKELLGEMLRQIFSTIQHVEKMTLSDWCIQVLEAMGKQYLLSSLSNVKFLKLNVGIIELHKLVNLLGFFPMLKMLVIEHQGYRTMGHNQLYVWEQDVTENYLELETNLPNSFLLQLRTIEIASSILTRPLFPIFHFIEFLLKHASVLEKMVIRTIVFSAWESGSLLAADKLLSMPRSSSTAKVIFLRKKNR